VDHHPTTQQYTLKLVNGASYTIPVAELYQGNADNGALANNGLHFHEGAPDVRSRIVDRSEHRSSYNEMLDPEKDA